ncbi:hypothetical protein D3C72_2592170 [compost metagenome]
MKRMSTENGRLLKGMKDVATQRIGRLLKYPSDASWVEKPPVAIVDIAWFSASKRLMPR